MRQDMHETGDLRLRRQNQESGDAEDRRCSRHKVQETGGTGNRVFKRQGCCIQKGQKIRGAGHRRCRRLDM